MNKKAESSSGRLVVVSNRVALPQEGAPGGLASALNAALQDRGGLWFGWSGELGRETAAEVHHLSEGNVDYATVDLSREDHEAYYTGFSNGALWPMLHYRPDVVEYHRDHLAGYMRVNELFAERLRELIRPDDTVWIHDYHLIPLASMLRRLGLKNRMGFFLHTPLPAAGLLIALPNHRQLLQTLASHDLIGVHTSRDLRMLEDYFLHEAGATMRLGGKMRTPDGRIFRAASFPISIDTAGLERAAQASVDLPEIVALRETLRDTTLIVGVDRMDYSKGLPQRFAAYARLLERAPEWHRKVTFLQIAPPSRGTVKEYRQIRRDLERTAGHINGKYAAPDWVPLRYINQSFPQSVLTGYYRSARVGLITPLRDGMNLVAKEYVASQDPEDPGVLILSRFAGSAEELTDALLVNPADTEEVTDALIQALTMSLTERRKRWNAMMKVLRKNDITHWRTSFLQSLLSE